MSNEELVILIQSGRDDLLPVLWEQVERFVAMQANQWVQAWKSRRVEFEDLYQSGFLAVVQAVQTYDPEKEVKFLTWLGHPLKTAFSAALGVRTEKQRLDPLNSASSLDAPLEHDTDDLTVGDTVSDPVDCYMEADRRIFLEQLHDALEQALDQLPEEQRATLRLRFYQGMTFKEAAETFGIPADQVRKRECEALRSLRQPGKQTDQLRAFLDERTPFYNAHGVHSVERLVLKRERICEGATAQSSP